MSFMRLELFLATALALQPIEELIPMDHAVTKNTQLSLFAQQYPDEAVKDWALVVEKAESETGEIRRIMYPGKGPKDKHTVWKMVEEETPRV